MTKEEAITFLKCDRERTCYDFKVGHCDGCNSRTALDMAIEALKAEPVKHGHWDNKIIDARFDAPHTVARCSVCKGKIWVYAENYVVRYPYCPLCGAKMDEVEDE